MPNAVHIDPVGSPDPIDASVAERLRDHLSPHPRLLLRRGDEAALRDRLEADERLGGLWRALLATADEMCGRPPVRREIEGIRLLAVSREVLHRVLTLGLAFRIGGDSRHLHSARDVLLQAAGFVDWNPSHFLDVAEMTAALAVGYDWLRDQLSEVERRALRQAIVEKGLRPSFVETRWWVDTENNWNQVCHAGLTMGALAVADVEPELCREVVARAVRNVPRAMQAYAPAGAYPEGPMYWAYATTFNVLLIDAMESAIGVDFGLSSRDGFLASADYFLHVTAPSGKFFNYADCREGGDALPSAAMFWLAARRDEPRLLTGQMACVGALLAGTQIDDTENARFAPLLLLWARRLPADGETPTATHYASRGGVMPVAMHRSSWRDDAAFVGIKGGSPRVNHAHMDVGSFVLEAIGERWAVDLGLQDYHSLESRGVNIWNAGPDGTRWNVFRLGARSHNLLTFDSHPQAVDGHAPIMHSSRDRTVVDLTFVAAGRVARHVRGVRLFADGAIRIQDDVLALPSAGTSARWTMVTRAEVKPLPDGSAQLKQNGKQISLAIRSPAGLRFAILEREPRPSEFDAANPGVTMLGVDLPIAAGEQCMLAIDVFPSFQPSPREPVEPLLTEHQ